VSAKRIPWDSPSQFGRAGLLARGAVRRLSKPVWVRFEAEQARLEEDIAELRAEQRDLDARTRQQAQTVADLRDDLDRTRAYADTTDRILDTLLVADLPAGARRITRHPARPRRAICSLATGDYRSLLARSALSFQRYADRWGWDLVLSTEDLADGRPEPWAKIPLVRSLLADYDWVLWLDADVVIVDLEADIGQEIEADRDLYLVEHNWSQYTANTGVFMLRSSDFARALLDQVWASKRYIDHPWWENAAVLALLGYGLEPARLVEPTPWLARTKLIDLRFNSVEVDRARRPAFVHRGLRETPVRLRLLTGDLACSLGSADPVTAGWDWPARRISRASDVRRRDELPMLLNALALTGTGVEVGIWLGEFSAWLLDLWAGQRLISVDPWRAVPADEYVDILNVPQDAQDSNHLEARRRLARFGSRSEVWRCTSADASAALEPGSLSFVYLDARHDEQSVGEDLRSWWPLIQPGGVFAGHDYLTATRPEGEFGVRSAVDAFFGGLGVAVHATPDDGEWPSWIVVKPV
jgi:hypothetical protein